MLPLCNGIDNHVGWGIQVSPAQHWI